MSEEAKNSIIAIIDAAEDVRDPLEGLVERTTTDPGAPFAPDTLGGFAAEERRPRRVRGAARAVEECGLPGDGARRGYRRGEWRVRRARPDAGRYPDRSGAVGRVVPCAGRNRLRRPRHQWPPGDLADPRQGLPALAGAPLLRGDAGRAELRGAAIGAQRDRGEGAFRCAERVVHIRVGGLDDRLYLDLGDETWRAVEIDATGWRVIDNPPVRFRRAAGMQPLPVPVPGDRSRRCGPSLTSSPTTTSSWWSPGRWPCLRDRGPYPVIVAVGRAGIGQVHLLGDPAGAARSQHRALARPAARGSRPVHRRQQRPRARLRQRVRPAGWISDTLCRLATGGGFAVRQLYTDQDEVLFDAARPVILNGIEDIVTRPDLADRALFLTLEPIPEERRRPEAGTLGGVRGRAPAHPGRAARCRGRGPQAAARDPAGSCRAWRTSRCGRRPARRRFGPPAPSGRPIAATATRRSRALSRPTRSPPLCAP